MYIQQPCDWCSSVFGTGTCKRDPNSAYYTIPNQKNNIRRSAQKITYKGLKSKSIREVPGGTRHTNM